MQLFAAVVFVSVYRLMAYRSHNGDFNRIRRRNDAFFGCVCVCLCICYSILLCMYIDESLARERACASAHEFNSFTVADRYTLYTAPIADRKPNPKPSASALFLHSLNKYIQPRQLHVSQAEHICRAIAI